MDISTAVRDFVANGRDFLHCLQTEGEKLGEAELDELSGHLHDLSIAVKRLRDVLLYKARGGQRGGASNLRAG